MKKQNSFRWSFKNYGLKLSHRTYFSVFPYKSVSN